MAEFVLTKYAMHSTGMKEMVNADYVRRDLTDRAERVRDQAAAGGPDYTYDVVQSTTDRVRVAVGSDDEGVLFYESATGNLLRALDAGGGTS